MRITYQRLLAPLRELYALPRDMKRFQAYLQLVTGGTDDIALPLGVANPMAKEHVLHKLDELIALGAEEAGERATAEVEKRLARVPRELRSGLVLADDLMGGWTNRYTTDAAARFQGADLVKRGFATTVLWVSESPSHEQIRQDVLATLYRALHVRRHGNPQTLRAMLVQEGRAGRFAGRAATLNGADLAQAETTFAPHLDATLHTAYSTAFACFYGDEGAVSVGYPPLGLPPFAGLSVGLAMVSETEHELVEALL